MGFVPLLKGGASDVCTAGGVGVGVGGGFATNVGSITGDGGGGAVIDAPWGGDVVVPLSAPTRRIAMLLPINTSTCSVFNMPGFSASCKGADTEFVIPMELVKVEDQGSGQSLKDKTE